jgi:hypothetical protein
MPQHVRENLNAGMQSVPNHVHMVYHHHSGGAQVPLSQVTKLVVLSS